MGFAIARRADISNDKSILVLKHTNPPKGELMKVIALKELRAGADLDRIVAENLMGWRPLHGHITGAGEQSEWMQKPDGYFTHPMNIPKFSSDIAEAYKVLERIMEILKDEAPWFEIRGPREFLAAFHTPKRAFSESGSTLSEAICRAALEVVFGSQKS
jgi:hypothetical protein